MAQNYTVSNLDLPTVRLAEDVYQKWGNSGNQALKAPD